MPVHAPTRAGDKPTCAEPEYLGLVDRAFESKGSGGGVKARDRLTEECCSRCPVWSGCLLFALGNNEHGPWAGTGDNHRTRARGSLPYTHNLRNIDRGENTGTFSRRSDTASVRAWARAEGIPVHERGLLAPEVYEAYDAAMALRDAS